MSQIIQEIHSMDELIEYASSVISKETDFIPVRIIADKISFRVKIEGHEWNKNVDVRHAKYIISLQDCIDDLIEDYGAPGIEAEQKIVKVEVNEGSSDMLPDITSVVKFLVTPMTPEHTFVSVTIAILSLAGYFAWKRWVDYKQETAALSEHEQTKRAMLAPIIAERTVRDAEFSPYERPVKTLVSTLEDEDRISFTGIGDVKATKEEAKESLPKKRRSEEQTSYADGEYKLNNIDYSHGELILHLEQDGQSIKAYTSQLSDEDAANLFSDIADRQLTEDLPLSLTLQINVKHTAKRIKYGSIVGTGEIRPGKHHVRICTLAS